MKKSIAATTLVIIVLSLLIGTTTPAFADSYTFTGLGGEGSAVSLVVIDGDLYAGMDTGHIWRYNGSRWTDFASLGSSVLSLVWDGVRIYAGTSSGVICIYEDGMWSGAGAATEPITCMSTSITAPGVVYAGCTDGVLYRLFFRGHADWEWSIVNDFTYPINSMYESGSYLYVVTQPGRVYSGLGSSSWNDLGYCGTSDPHITYNNSVGLCAGGYNCRIWQYAGGTTWNDTVINPSNPRSLTAVCNAAGSVCAGSLYGTIFYYQGIDTYTIGSTPYAGSAVQALAWDGSSLYVSYANGHICRFTDPTTWSDIWPTSGADVNALLSHDGNVYAGCGNGRVYEHDGNNWALFGDAMPSDVLSLAASDTRIYAGCNNGNVYYYNSGTWTGTSGPGVANSLAYDGSTLYAGCADGNIWYYNESGGGWQDGGTPENGTMNCLVWTGADLYAGTGFGEVYRYDGPHDFQATGLNTREAATIALCWNSSTLYASSAYGDVFSYNGSTWDTIFTTSLSESIHSLAGNGNTIFGGNGEGTVMRYMGGTDWTESGSAGLAAIDALIWTGDSLFTGSASGSWRGAVTVPPTVTSNNATSVESTTATLNGNITSTGGENADTRGFRYRKSGAGTWTDWTEAGSFGTGAFSHAVTGLEPVTEYEYQACAHNMTGWTYGSTLEFKTPVPKPSVESVTPSRGPVGTQVTVKGSNFGDKQGSSTIKVGGVTADAVSWSDTEIVIVVPEDTKGGAVVVTTTAGGGSNTNKIFTVTEPGDLSTWYLAEGTNAWGFNTYITIENPNGEAVKARLTYMDTNPSASGKGIISTQTITLPPNSQTTLSSLEEIGEADFSTKVQCLEGKSIAVDRTMFWTGEGCSESQSGYHSSIGTTSSSKTWYLPEGSSAWGFETWTLVENPNGSEATVTLNYMTEGKGATTVEKKVPANSRATYSMQDDIGEADASIKVTSDQPVVVERSMYRNNRREGSCSIGTTTPGSDYYLAEGATGYGVNFTTYILVQNPGDEANEVTLTYETQSGVVTGPSFTMEPDSRKTVKVNDQFLSDTNVSTHVHGSKTLVAERAMYWDNGTGEAFHDSIGMDSPHTIFYLPDGQTSNGAESWTLVENPNSGDVKVEITYLTESGTGDKTFTETIPANSRSTFNMADQDIEGRAAVLVTCKTAGKKIICERSMYWNNRGAGTDTIGGYSD